MRVYSKSWLTMRSQERSIIIRVSGVQVPLPLPEFLQLNQYVTDFLHLANRDQNDLRTVIANRYGLAGTGTGILY